MNEEVKSKLEKRLQFEYEFCSSRCSDKVCNHRYNGAQCTYLHNALITEGFIEEQKCKKEEKVIQFPVNMDKMQRNILIELLNARKECTEENILTARGCVAIIDALFYLVKGKPIVMGIDMGDINGDKTVFLDNDAICKITGNYCIRCTPGYCKHREVK